MGRSFRLVLCRHRLASTRALRSRRPGQNRVSPDIALTMDTTTIGRIQDGKITTSKNDKALL